MNLWQVALYSSIRTYVRSAGIIYFDIRFVKASRCVYETGRYLFQSRSKG